MILCFVQSILVYIGYFANIFYDKQQDHNIFCAHKNSFLGSIMWTITITMTITISKEADKQQQLQKYYNMCENNNRTSRNRTKRIKRTNWNRNKEA